MNIYSYTLLISFDVQLNNHEFWNMLSEIISNVNFLLADMWLYTACNTLVQDEIKIFTPGHVA